MRPSGPLEEILMEDSDAIMTSDFNASRDDSRTDRNPQDDDHHDNGYQDSFNDTDDYSNKDDVSYQTDEESYRRDKPDVHAVALNPISQGSNDGVASRSVSNATASSVRAKAFSFQNDDLNSINVEINQCTQNPDNCLTSSLRPVISAASKRPPRKGPSSKSIRRAVNETSKEKNYKASWIPSSDEDV